jgi:nucleotide-binding universal stress UspA family protein
MAAAHTRRLVVAFDGTDVGEDALAFGSWLAEATGDVPLVVDVYPEDPVPVLPGIGSQWLGEMRSNAELVLDKARRLLGGRLEAEFRAVAASSAARGLDRVATEVSADMIVLGSTHRGVLRRTGIGKTADRLLQGSSTPVIVAPRGTRDRLLPEPETIGCAYVPTPEGELALRRAADLAERSGALLKIFSVVAHGVEIPDRDRDRDQALVDQARSGIEQAVERARSSLPAHVKAETVLLEGGVVDSLSSIDCTEVQLLVCGSRGYGPVGRVLLGGVSGRLVRRALCPVMVVPRDAVDRD